MDKKKLGIIIASVVIILIIIGSIVIFNNRSSEKDAPYGPGAPTTIEESDPVEPEPELDN